MLDIWTKGLNDLDKTAIETTIRKNRTLLDRINVICEMKIKELEVSALADYDSPSWAYRAADKEGQKRALRYIMSLTKAERNT